MRDQMYGLVAAAKREGEEKVRRVQEQLAEAKKEVSTEGIGKPRSMRHEYI